MPATLRIVLIVSSLLFVALAIWLSRCFGIKTPSNFIYLAAICALQALMFHLTVQHSKLKQQIRRLIQDRAISNYLQSKEKGT